MGKTSAEPPPKRAKPAAEAAPANDEHSSGEQSSKFGAEGGAKESPVSPRAALQPESAAQLVAMDLDEGVAYKPSRLAAKPNPGVRNTILQPRKVPMSLCALLPHLLGTSASICC